MKKSIVVVALFTMMLLAGCGKEKGDAVETPKKVYTYEKDYNMYYSEESSETTHRTYQLCMFDDNKATLEEKSVTEGSYSITYNYQGTYETQDDYIKFSYDNLYDDSYYYVFEMKNDKIVSVADIAAVSSIVTDLTGVYTCDDSEYGKLELSVSPFSSAIIKSDTGVVATGYIAEVNGRKNLMVYDPEHDVNFDWYIYVDGDTFTYEYYYEGVECTYSGDYTVYGDLGEFTITVLDDTTAYASVEIDGVLYSFSGSAYEVGYGEGLGSAYLYSEDGMYSLDLYFEDITGDGKLNYSGSISRPLSAG